MIHILTEDIKELVIRIQDTEDLIGSLTQPVKNTQAILQRAFEKFKDKIRDDFELSVPSLMNALTSLVSSPNKLIFGVQTASLLYDGFTSIPEVDGRLANKDYIIRKMKYGEATVADIKGTLEKDLDGQFVLDDPFGTRLMTAKEDMLSFLEAYATSSFVDVIDEMMEKFDAFVEAVIARNDQVMLYNIQLQLYQSKIASREDYEEKEREFRGQEIEATDPNLPIITAYMGDIYQSSRERVMAVLDTLVRSLNFRMLRIYDIFELAFGGSLDKVPLSITSDVLRSGRALIEDEFWKTLDQVWGKPAIRFPAHFDDPIGKRIYLTKDELADLKTDRRVRST